MPQINGIHHLKFPVSDLQRGIDFYTRALGAKHLPELDHKHANGDVYGVILQVPNLGPMLELRLNPDAARAQAGFDLVTLAVQNRAALEDWMRHLDELAVAHSSLLTALVSWLVVIEDPDGHRLRFYSLEQHPLTDKPSTDPRWLD